MRKELIYNSSIVKITPRAWMLSSLMTKLKLSGLEDEEILKKLKIGKNTLKKIRNLNNDSSLNSLLAQDNDSEELEKLILVDYQTPCDICIENDETDYLNSVISNLNKREREIIERKFGLYGYKKLNLREISKVERVSKERIRQLLTKGLKNLKKTLPKNEFY